MNEKQIYGIFGEGSSSDEETRKKKSASSQPTMNINKGYMNFVKSDKVIFKPEANTVRVSYGKKKSENEAQISEKKMEIAKEKKPKSVQINEDKNQQILFDKSRPISTMDDFISSEDDEKEEASIEARINQEILKRKKKFDLKKSTSNEMEDFGLPTILGKRKNPTIETLQPKKLTEELNEEAEMQGLYGKGLKMMQALGYRVGTGLGSQEQGRVEPIQAFKKTMLDGKKPISSSLDKNKNKGSSLQDEFLNDLEEEKLDIEESEKPKLWKKGKSRNRMKVLRKTRHIKPNDISVPESEIVKPIIQQKVIDMRGPQIMYFEDYSALKNLDHSKQVTTSSKPTVLNEMLLTLRGNIDKTKYNLQSSERKIKIEKDKIVNYNYEKTHLQERQQTFEKNLNGLKILKTKLNEFRIHSDSLNSLKTLQLFEDCFLATPEQFSYLNLEHLFLSTILKKIQLEVQSWKINESTLEFNYELFTNIKSFLIKVLQCRDYLKYKSYTDDFSSLISDQSNYDNEKLEKYLTNLFSQTWTLPVRSFILNEWKPEDSEILISLFEKWKAIVPNSITTQLYDTVVMPKLQQFVDQWSPTSDKIPIHIRLHPWFPLLGNDRLEKVWKLIQLKISQLLLHWEPQDKSALILLKPWLRVFDQKTWENLIIRCILPKLLYAMKDFEINPKKQKIDPLKWLLEWADYIPYENLIGILENYVLRKIVEVGMEWISSSNCKVGEVRGWLSGWKELLGEKIMKFPAVNHYFQSFENILNR